MPGTTAAPTQYAMPGFDWRMTDKEVAAVVSFVRSSWGNQAGAVSVRRGQGAQGNGRGAAACALIRGRSPAARLDGIARAAGVQDVGH